MFHSSSGHNADGHYQYHGVHRHYVGIIVTYFHAGLSLAERKRRLLAFRARTTRVMITTTSLKMGINCPVTHVIIRDHVVRDDDRPRDLAISDKLQMMGRAGRVDLPGHSVLLCNSGMDGERYREGLSAGRIEGIQPRLIRGSTTRWSRARRLPKLAIDPLNGVVLTELVLRESADAQFLREFAEHTYSASRGNLQAWDLRKNLAFLEQGKLIYRLEGSEDTYASTKLGKTVSLCGISPESGAMLAGFLRALINLGEKTNNTSANYLRRLRDLDFLFLALASFEARGNWVPKPSRKAIESTQEYLETLDPEQKPLINLWRSEQSKEFPTHRLLVSLKVDIDEDTTEHLRTVFYLMLGTAVLLHRHSRGVALMDLAREYRLPEGAMESGLKYTSTWVLNCLAQICDSRKAYNLGSLQTRILQLLENLSLGATLGPLLRIEGIGRRTVYKLIDAGILTMSQMAAVGRSALQALGLTAKQARSITTYVARSRR